MTRIMIALALCLSTSIPSYASQEAGDYPAVTQAGTGHIDDALDRIIPKTYQIVLDDSVPASTVLSWTAGRSWLSTLNDALYPDNLSATLSGTTVSIGWIADKRPPRQKTMTGLFSVTR